jgi:hypothetical protein
MQQEELKIGMDSILTGNDLECNRFLRISTSCFWERRLLTTLPHALVSYLEPVKPGKEIKARRVMVHITSHSKYYDTNLRYNYQFGATNRLNIGLGIW